MTKEEKGVSNESVCDLLDTMRIEISSLQKSVKKMEKTHKITCLILSVFLLILSGMLVYFHLDYVSNNNHSFSDFCDIIGL